MHANLAEILAYLLSQEGEKVDDIFSPSFKVFAQLRVLCGDAHRTGVGVAFAHHHAAQYNQRQRAERELVGAQHRHDNHVFGCLQLAVGLQAHLIAQAVHHQRLLRLGQSDLGRDAGKAHRAGGAGARTAFGAADDDEVGLRFCHTGGDGAHTALGHEFHANGCRRVDVLQVEDELGQIFDGVDVVMRRGRDERDAGDGVACLGDDVVHLEAGQLAALARLGALGHLDLYLFGVHQIFCRHTEAAAGDLLGLA